MSILTERLAAVRARIEQAERQYQRPPGSVQLIAVSKTRPVSDVQLLLREGQHCFGESYVQEAVEKISALAGEAIEWHFIGPIQSNKTRAIAEHFAWVQSVDRLKIAQRLQDQRPAHLPPLNICLQVNISRDPAKAGVAPEELAELARAIAALDRLHLRGLMAIPSYSSELEQQRRPFQALRNCLEDLQARGFELDTLSMGMSNDMEAAIAEGATMVRIGTDIFGPRQKPQTRA